MTSQLEVIFRELGISHYLHTFVDQGFDTWDTILDITESDLDALGVKLGHRRKLQRRIANSRGLAPEAALVSPTRQSIEESRPDGFKSETSKVEGPPTAVAKRKYRRHPKPDEDAPERPPSAYVLFSNKMREDLKDRNLSFTEIAKLVGDNWQNLSSVEKEPFETQAQKAKDKYARELVEYKKTPEYKKYMTYLADFKAKHSGPTLDKDASKRVKITGSSAGSPSGGSTPRRGRSSTHSGSDDGQRDSVRPRKHRASSATDTRSEFADIHMTDGHYNEPPSARPVGSQQAYADGQHREDAATTGRKALPRFSDVFDDGSSGVGAMLQHSRRGGSTATTPGSLMTTPGLVGGHQFKPPSLTKQYSSTDSTSTASTASWPRTPLDNPLPIHALLSGKPGQQVYELPNTSAMPLSHSIHGKTAAPHHPASPSYPFPVNRTGSISSSDSFFPSGHPTSGQHRQSEHHPGSPPTSARGVASHTSQQDGHRPNPLIINNSSSNQGGNLDGIAALLQARDIVDRRGQQ